MLSFQDLDLSKKYSYADYLTWKFNERVELYLGKVVKISPAPNLQHQRISGIIFIELGIFLKKKPCQVFAAPFDVRLPLAKSEKIDTVVQPDITIICDESKLDKQGCIGAPDIVMEILSPGNTKKEMREKLRIYQDSGIPEYWLIDPEHEFILLYHLDELGKYNSSLPFVEDDIIKSKVLNGFELDVKEVFS